MMLQVKKMSQDLDLENGSVSNFVLLQLPNGGVIRAQVDEAAALAITNCHVMGVDAPQPASVDTEPVVFGGDFSGPNGFAPAASYTTGKVLLGHAVTSAPARPRSVTANEFGYPVLQGGDGRDPGEISTGQGQDEDGVGQV